MNTKAPLYNAVITNGNGLNLVDSLHIHRQREQLKKHKERLGLPSNKQPSEEPIRFKPNSSHTQSSNLILNTKLAGNSFNHSPMIGTPRFQPNQEKILEKITYLETKLEEQQRESALRISEMQKQINWLTTTVYTLQEQVKIHQQNITQNKSKNDGEEKMPDSPPGLPEPHFFQRNTVVTPIFDVLNESGEEPFISSADRSAKSS